ncbi:MAG: NUDIX hydrolase [Hyphomicrobiaceae bacterium]
MADFTLNMALREHLRANLDRFAPQDAPQPDLKSAAVAVVIAAHEPGSNAHPAILLTLRSARLKQHSGQYALPGGKLDAGETPAGAALRELHEELGLSLNADAVLGRLDDYPTRSGYRITPIVVWAGADCALIPSPDEVEKVFRIPFHELASDAIPVFEPGIDESAPILFCEFPTLGHRMYSPTASILFQFREVAMRGVSTRVAHFDQPRFAWT